MKGTKQQEEALKYALQFNSTGVAYDDIAYAAYHAAGCGTLLDQLFLARAVCVQVLTQR